MKFYYKLIIYAFDEKIIVKIWNILCYFCPHEQKINKDQAFCC